MVFFITNHQELKVEFHLVDHPRFCVSESTFYKVEVY